MLEPRRARTVAMICVKDCYFLRSSARSAANRVGRGGTMACHLTQTGGKLPGLRLNILHKTSQKQSITMFRFGT